MSVHFLESLDVGTRCFEDPQPQEPEHRHQSEVVDVRRLPASGEHGFELEVAQAQRR